MHGSTLGSVNTFMQIGHSVISSSCLAAASFVSAIFNEPEILINKINKGLIICIGLFPYKVNCMLQWSSVRWNSCKLIIHSFKNFIAPLQGNYSDALPTPARTKRYDFK